MDYQLYATCPDELTSLLAKEIIALGGSDVHTAYRVVYFPSSKELFYKAHLYLRLASRLGRILKEIPAQSPTIIFDKAKKIRFDQLFSPQTRARHQCGRIQRSSQNPFLPDRQQTA